MKKADIKQTMVSLAEGEQCNVCIYSWRGEARLWGEKMFDFSLEGWISIGQRVQCCKNILRHRQQQMQSADMCRVDFVDVLLIDNQEACFEMRLEKETGPGT